MVGLNQCQRFHHNIQYTQRPCLNMGLAINRRQHRASAHGVDLLRNHYRHPGDSCIFRTQLQCRSRLWKPCATRNVAMKHKISHLCKLNSERAQSLVEFAISLLLILTILTGAVELSLALFEYVTIRDAAQEGALFASVNPRKRLPFKLA